MPLRHILQTGSARALRALVWQLPEHTRLEATVRSGTGIPLQMHMVSRLYQGQYRERLTAFVQREIINSCSGRPELPPRP